MTTQPEDTVEPVVQDPAPPAEKPPVKAESDNDTLPLTLDEVAEAGKEVVNTVKNGFLMPVYRLGRRYIRSAQDATESFFDGVVNEKKKD